MNRVVLSVGANLGDKYVNCERVLDYISDRIGVIVSKSANYESPSWGFDSVDNFVNNVVVVDTELFADSLIKVIWEIELLFGKCRGSIEEVVDGYSCRRESYDSGESIDYISRFMDIDIIYFNSDVICSDLLDVPHKLMSQRDFVLVPLCEVLPDFVHPVLGRSSLELLNDLGGF